MGGAQGAESAALVQWVFSGQKHLQNMNERDWPIGKQHADYHFIPVCKCVHVYAGAHVCVSTRVGGWVGGCVRSEDGLRCHSSSAVHWFGLVLEIGACPEG